MAFGWDDLIGLILAGTQVGGLFGGGGQQERSTFEGERRGDLSLDPRDLLGMGLTNLGRTGQTLEDRLHEDVSLPGAYAQAPPTFTGGGLPMPIGVTGRDPAVSDPGTHLRKPGVTPRRDLFHGLGNLMSGDPTTPGGPGPGDATSPGGGSDDPTDMKGWGSPRGNDIMGGEEDDQAAEADAAIQLLMGGRG